MGENNQRGENMELRWVTNQDPQAWEGRRMSFGERVRKIRTEQGLTAKELSTASGVPEKTIYRIETGEVSDPKLSTIVPLVKALNCSADELVLNIEDFTKMGQLRQLFLNFKEMQEHEQEFLLDVIRRMKIGMAMEGACLMEVAGHRVLAFPKEQA